MKSFICSGINFESNNTHFPIEEITNALEKQGWACIEKFISEDQCFNLLNLFKNELEQDKFVQAEIGKGAAKSLQKSIRNSRTCWIEDWEESSSLINIQALFNQIKQTMNYHFFLSLKRWESQFAFYEKGGFYKKHLDQLKENNHRQVTCIFYLNDCEEGGELVIYDRDDKNKIAAKITPRAGMCVIFFSSQIYHEVLTSKTHRYSLTTWFRDDIA